MPVPASLETSGKYANRVLFYVFKRMPTVLPSCEKSCQVPSKCKQGSDDVKMHSTFNILHFMPGSVILIHSGKYIYRLLIICNMFIKYVIGYFVNAKCPNFEFEPYQ